MDWFLLANAAGFFWLQNHYFGWNTLPKTDAELICDGISALLLSLAFIKDKKP